VRQICHDDIMQQSHVYGSAYAVTLSTSAVTVAGFRHNLLMQQITPVVSPELRSRSSQPVRDPAQISRCVRIFSLQLGDVFRISFPAPLTVRELSVGILYSYFFSVIAFDRMIVSMNNCIFVIILICILIVNIQQF